MAGNNKEWSVGGGRGAERERSVVVRGEEELEVVEVGGVGWGWLVSDLPHTMHMMARS